ncbi:hypothetical protein CEXT_515791 [Caerostris extrusa]|uniref:Uncharacterized protein n=1 Tax=Caerostris extrusa TaxID=172846 RepID=A0AAV4RQP6_CAEEX|nr:hypothetical protein CEXT_515791 [Caerostris extrusa]
MCNKRRVLSQKKEEETSQTRYHSFRDNILYFIVGPENSFGGKKDVPQKIFPVPDDVDSPYLINHRGEMIPNTKSIYQKRPLDGGGFGNLNFCPFRIIRCYQKAAKSVS